MNKILGSGIKICFFFPYHEISGVPVLFSRIANQLADSNVTWEILVIDYIDGAMSRNLIVKPNLKLIPFVDGEIVSPPNDSILVMQSILPYTLRPELKIQSNTRLIFWNLHPDNLVPCLIPLPWIRDIQKKYFMYYFVIARMFNFSLIKNLGEFIRIANSKHGIWFMDQSNLDKTCKYLFIDNLNIEYMPVPAIASSMTKTQNKQLSELLKVTWIGRLCNFKSHILIYTLKKLSILAYHKKIKIKFSIIGDGPFKKKINDLNLNHDWFSLEILGVFKPSELDSYLLENTDVLTAMGTSALEGAKLGIPTILLDISEFPIKHDYKFRWLHESQNFDLGHDLNESDFEEGNLSLNFMIESLIENYESISICAFEYFKQNHSIDFVLRLFQEKILKTELKFSDIQADILKKSVFRKIYDSFKYRIFNS